MKPRLLFVLLVGLVACGGYAIGQDKGEAAGAAKTFLFDVLAIETVGGAEAHEKAARAIMQSPDSPEAVQQAIRMGMVGSSKDPSLLLAVQTAQNQKIIEQNARIIELLEKQAK